MSIDKCPTTIIGKSPVNATRGSHAPGVNNSMSDAFSDILSSLNAEEATSAEDNITLEDGVNFDRPLDSPKDNLPTLIPSSTSSLVPSQTTDVTQQEGFKLEGFSVTRSPGALKDELNPPAVLLKSTLEAPQTVTATQQEGVELEDVSATQSADALKDELNPPVFLSKSTLMPPQTSAVTQEEGVKLEDVSATQSSDVSKDDVTLPFALSNTSLLPKKAVTVSQEQRDKFGGGVAQLSPDRSKDSLTHPIVLSKISSVPTQAVAVTQSDGSMVDIRGNNDLQSLRTIDKSKPETDALAGSLVPQRQGERTAAFAVSQDPAWDVALAQNSSSIPIARSVKGKNKSVDDIAVEAKPDTKNTFFELAKSDWRFSNERNEGFRLSALAAIEQKPETLPTLVGLFGDYRQEKNSAGVTAAPTSLDVTHALGGDAKSAASDVLLEKFSDYASPASGDQNPSTYWMSSDMKNAEMQLDGLGEGPVEVSISMQGNQAHVVFRSDESQTRSVLEGTGGALRDMLSQEGLELGGVFVGAKHSEGGHERGHQQESQRHSKDPNLGQFPLNAGRERVARAVGGLDVFV